jgi:cytochrome c553
MKKQFLMTLVLGVALTAEWAHAGGGDAAAGKQTVEKICAACHGLDGNKPLAADYPRLGGQNADYLLKALTDYKSGARKNPIMGAQVANLKDEQAMKDVAAYFASQAGLSVKR